VLKPIDIEELQTAVEKLKDAKQNFTAEPENYQVYYNSLRNLSDALLKNKPSSRITISHTKGMKIVEDENISHLEASGNCTLLYFTDGTRYLDTRTLKTYENMLDPSRFVRIHKSHIINLDRLTEYLTEDGHFAVLKGGIRIPVARNRVTDFVKRIKHL
jgi:two-component system LytT family response regulator